MTLRGRISAAVIFLLLLGGFGALPLPAIGDEVLAPTDGAMVGAAPTFQFSVLNGAAELEFSRSPDVRTAGPEIGTFVDRGEWMYSLLYNRRPLDGLAPWTDRPLHRGTWFWHARVRDDSLNNGAGDFGAWGQVRRLVVKDEDPVLEGWTFRTQRLRGRPGCAHRVRFFGRVAWSDNSDAPRVSVSIVLTGGRWDTEIRLPASAFDHVFSVVRCVQRSRLTGTVQLSDDAGHTTVSDDRYIRA